MKRLWDSLNSIIRRSTLLRHVRSVMPEKSYVVRMRRSPKRRFDYKGYHPQDRRAWLLVAALTGLVLFVVLRTSSSRDIIPAPAQPTQVGSAISVSTPEPTATPQPPPTPEPTATPQPTQSVRDMSAPVAETAVVKPSMRITSRQALVDLYWWMIRAGVEKPELDALTLTDEQISEITLLFSNYFESYTCNVAARRLSVEFKSGLRILLAIENGMVGDLSAEEQKVADQALSAVSSIIKPSMNLWERELAVHDYVAQHCEYLVAVEGFNADDCRGFFQHGACRCAGYVDTMRLLARLSGLEVEMMGGPTTRDSLDSRGHAWNIITLNGLNYAVDVTWDDMSGGATRIEHTYFNLPLSAFGKSRSWDQYSLPPGKYAQAFDGQYYFDTADYAASDVRQGAELAAAQLDKNGAAYVFSTEKLDSDSLTQSLRESRTGTVKSTNLADEMTFTLIKYTES